MTKILLTTVIRPFGINSDDCTDRILPELHHGQVTFAQGVFSIRGYYGGFGLEYMAINIKPKTIVLNYPSETEFINELKKGYDYVGITFVMATFPKMKKMAALVRQYTPNSKLILGGYGTTIPGTEELADYVCREEGVTFMRRLLGEDIDAPRDHPVIKQRKSVFGYPTDGGSIILAGLGCPNGCDFCITSHFYQRKHIALLPTGKDIWDVLMKIDKKIHTRSVGIMEEDFLLYKPRVLELAEYTRKETTNPIRIAGFSSIRSIAMYDPVFLAEMGIETLWVGIESHSSTELRKKNASKKVDIGGHELDISSYSKMDNVDIEKIIKGLHDVGINTLISMIVGLEHHTEELVKADLDYHISLNPTLSQFAVYTPIPGTPLYECLNKEGRILKDVPWHKVDGFHACFKHPYLSTERLHDLQYWCFDEDYQRLGPSIFRFLEKTITGYLRFCDSDIPIQQIRAKSYEEFCRTAQLIIDAGIKFAPNDKIAGRITQLKDKVEELFGKPNIGIRLVNRLAILAAKHNQTLISQNRWVIQPKLQRIVYH